MGCGEEEGGAEAVVGLDFWRCHFLHCLCMVFGWMEVVW